MLFQGLLIFQVIGLGRFGVVHGRVVQALEVRAGLVHILVQVGRLGNLGTLVQVRPAFRVLEGFMRPLEVQAQVKRFVLVTLLEPLERPISVAIGIIALVFLGGAIGAMQCGVEIFSLPIGHRVVARATRELLHVPFASDTGLVASFCQFANVAGRVLLEPAVEVQRAGHVAVLAGDNARATGRADGVVAADIRESHPLGCQPVNRGRVHKIPEPRAIRANRLRRVVIAHHEQDVRPLGRAQGKP